MASNNKNTGSEKEAPLVGTWISVGVVGVVILTTYIILYGLYLARV